MARPEDALPRKGALLSYVMLAIGLPISIIIAFSVTFRFDRFAIFSDTYFVLVVVGLPLLAFGLTIILLMSDRSFRRAPFFTALWIVCVGYFNYWLLFEISMGV